MSHWDWMVKIVRSRRGSDGAVELTQAEHGRFVRCCLFEAEQTRARVAKANEFLRVLNGEKELDYPPQSMPREWSPNVFLGWFLGVSIYCGER